MTAEEILRKHVGEIYLFSEHATQSEIDSLRMKTIEAMEIYAESLQPIDLFERLEEYMENRADVSTDDPETPNTEMRFLTEIQELLNQFKPTKP